MSKLALAIIVKDELDLIKSILEKYSKYFDEVAIAVDYKLDEFNKLTLSYPNLKVHHYTWCNDFSHKRNFLADKVESSHYFRIDTDDEISNPENIKTVFNKMLSHDMDIVYFNYDYARDDDGNLIASHWRESIIRKRPDIYWKKTIHENLFIENQNNFKGVKDDSIRIIHNITPEHARKSEERNWQILVEEYKRDKENTDPRTIAYIGRMLIGFKKYKEAIKFLELLVLKSGWDDDKYFAYIHMSQAYSNLNDIEMAISCCNEALAINTKFPDAFLRLGELCLSKQDYQKAIDWIEIGLKREKPDTMMVLDISVYTYRPIMNLALAYFYIGDFERAWKFFSKAKEIAPNNEFIKHNEALFVEAMENDKYIKNLAWIVSYTKNKDPQKLPKLVEALPKTMLKDERIMALKNQYCIPVVWPEKSIALFCGPAWEDWSPTSVLTGIGGSEEAVIYVSRELNKLGFSVTVFCSCGDMAGTYDGVTYKEFTEFNHRDEFDILVAWRHNIFIEKGQIKARKKIIWLHDVPSDDMFPEESINNFDKILVLSQYHKSLLPKHVPDEKIFVTSNGINLSDFKYDILERNAKRAIYTSSYDRGLEHLLDMWPDVRKQAPGAELHIFYGWNTYDAMVEKGVRDSFFKKIMVSKMDQPGVFDHGRVGHKELAKELAKSGVYAYPSHFEEISCISAMKAQASGCVPVTTDYAALSETVKYGVKVEGKGGDFPTKENYMTALIDMLNDVDKQEKIRKQMLGDKSRWGWDKVARTWAVELFV